MGRKLAIDFGLKRTGIAITDEMNIIASGLATVDSRELMTFLEKTVQEKNVDTIVLGEPKRMDQSDSHISQNVRYLHEDLVKKFPLIQVVLIDERFTSKMAFQSMIDNGMSKKQRQNKGLIDEISATIILQSYMSQL
ncbi:MAG: Holliday junction resolvase RuvX [Crocinitomicaceae bacterium]|nr:Holliday junction resolvase RuvX [Crocinitomicaceae bacterium]